MDQPPGSQSGRGFRGVGLAAACFAASLVACARGPSLPQNVTTNQALHANAPAPAAQGVYQPLAAGDYWKFICNHQFTILDRVLGTTKVGTRVVYEMSLQIPSSPTKSVKVVQLLANDTGGNTWIYGYLIDGKVHAVKAAKIVVRSPVLNAHYDYPAPLHGSITRVFKGFEFTNRTPLGVFYVAPYFESNATHNYGYSRGRGVMEEDHGPHYEYDCLIEKYLAH